MNAPHDSKVGLSAALVAALAFSAGVTPGCGSASKTGEAPASAINDKEAGNAEQIASMRKAWEQVEAGEADARVVRESLKRAAWARSSWWKVRAAAIDTLLVDEANLADTRNMLRLMLPTETQWPIIEKVGTLASEHGWKDLTVALVRSWSRPVASPTDAERPERKALEALYPGQPVEDVVFGVFTGSLAPGQELRDRDRQDAWSLLRRLDGDGSRARALLSAPPTPGEVEDPLLGTLRAAARELACVPATGEQLQWASELRKPEHAAFWKESATIVARLTDEQKRGLELRHLSGLRWAEAARPDLLQHSRSELLDELAASLKPQKKHPRASDSDVSIGGGESLHTWRDKLAWGDAILILSAMSAKDDAPLVESIFLQVDEDRSDASTEHGGVIDAPASAGAGFTARAFVPRPAQRIGDRQFIASNEMLAAGAESLFHYHFHVQSNDNSKYAGPSPEDVQYAARYGRSCLVLTSVASGVLDVDYYQPGGAVIDLGEIRSRGAAK